MNVFAVQSNIAWENPRVNLARTRALLDSVRIPPGSLVALPEMFATGFSMNTPTTLDDGTASDFLVDLARSTQSVVVGGLVEPGESKPGRNTALAIDPQGNLLARYGKMFPFSLGGETDAHESGADVVFFRLEDMIVSPFICYDLRFPEIFRIASGKGAELLLVIANWPAKRIGHWVTLLQARAIENLAYVIGVNRCGADPFHDYPGRSLVIDPHGQILADAGDQECVILADIDPKVVRHWRREFPALRDRRLDLDF